MGEHQRNAPASGLMGRTVHLINGFLDGGDQPKGVDFGDDFIRRVMQGKAPADDEELWCINGWWYYAPRCTLGFEMHDFGGPSFDAHPNKDWYINTVIGTAPIPIFMPRADARFPHVQEYPLREVEGYFLLEEPYFGESPNYMIALAVMRGAGKIVFHGFDYPAGYPKSGERASTEFWCGIAHAHGVKLEVPPGQNLLWPDVWEDFYEERRYGYKRADADR